MGLSLPDPAKLVADFTAAYALIDIVGEPISIILRNEDGSYAAPVAAMAKVSQFRIQDLIEGSPARQGDFKAILRTKSIPAGQRRLEQRDRVLWRSKSYAVVNYDDATHSVYGAVLAVELWLRG